MEQQAYNLLSGENIGSVVIGVVISIFLFGVIVMQGYDYYGSYSNDHLPVKVLAGMVLILEMAHSLTITYMIYHYLVILRGFPLNGPNTYPLAVSTFPGSLVSTLVQGFFAFRIFRLSGTLYICAICWFLFILRLGGGLAITGEALIDVPRVPNTVTVLSQFRWLIYLVFIIGAVADVIIATSLCYYFKRMTLHEMSTNTSRLLNRLMLWIVRTGMVTSIVSIAIVISFYLKPDSEIWFALYTVSTKLYSTTFFLSLNMRRGLRERYTPDLRAGGLQIHVKTTTYGNPGGDRDTTLDLARPNEASTSHSSEYTYARPETAQPET